MWKYKSTCFVSDLYTYFLASFLSEYLVGHFGWPLNWKKVVIAHVFVFYVHCLREVEVVFYVFVELWEFHLFYDFCLDVFFCLDGISFI